MENQLGFAIDHARCIGCRTCQMACKDYKGLDVGQNFRRIYEYEGGNWKKQRYGTYSQNVFAYYTSISCNHCANPACVKACPTGAMHKRKKDGIVVVNQDKCIGCKSCSFACPYDAPQYNAKTGKMNKCNMCVERLEVGKNPICVDACPNRALFQGNLQELRHEFGTTAATAPLVSSKITNPSLVIKKSKDSKPVRDHHGRMTSPGPDYPLTDLKLYLDITK